MRSLDSCRLYTFVDTAYLGEMSPRVVAQQLCDGGSDLIQLRAKDRSPEQILRIAEDLLAITDRAGVGLVINDHWRVAHALGAPVCHLGQEDFFDAGYQHRDQLFPPASNLKLGLSSHAPFQANRAVEAGADYVAVGPVYRTDTKPTTPPVTLEYVQWAAENLTIPWFAIGGINLQNLDEVLNAGARAVCVVSAILKAPDIVRACQQFKDRLSSAPQFSS